MTTKTTTMNIMKKLASTFALAAAAFAAPIAASAAEGDINRIYPCNEGGVEVANGTADDPIRSGGKFYFAVRVLKRDASDNPWRLHHVSTSSELVDDVYDPLEIGIYVSGKLTYAKYCGSNPVNNCTDFIFSYDVKPGDFAMPVVLAVDQDNPKPANETTYKDKSYHFSPTSLSKWAVDDSTEAGEVATQTANFYFKSTAEDADYDLRGAGFYVQTLDFSPTSYEVPSSGEEVQATIKLDTTPTNTVRLYVWSLDETQVKVKGTNKSIQFGPDVAADMQTRSVGTIDVVAGKSEYTIRMTAGTAPVVGQTTQIVLNGFGDFSYSAITDDRYVDYLTADVTVGEPLEPSISFADAEGNANPTIEIEATTNTTVYKEVKLVFSKAYDAADVAVTIKQQIGGEDVSTDDDYQANRYFAILTKSDANPLSTAYTDTITMPKGKKEVSFYVFALGSTDALASGVSLVPDVSSEAPAVQSFFANGTHGSTLLKVTDQKPTISVTAPSNGYCGDTASVKVTVADNWRDLQPAWNTNGYHVVIELGGETVCDQDGVSFESRKAKSFDVKIPVEGTVTGRVYVYDPTHEDDAAEATFAMSVDSARAASPTISNAAGEAYTNGIPYFAENETPYFSVTLTSDATQDMWAFLVPMDANASNLVSCTAVSNGLFIAAGTGSRKSSTAAIKFLDGFSSTDPMRAKFSVRLRSRQDISATDATDYSSSFVYRTIELVCTNVSPSIVNNSMSLNGSYVSNGGSLGSTIPVGAAALFTARVSDPSVKDLEATDGNEIQTKWTFTDGDAEHRTTETAYMTVTNGVVSCAHEFAYEGQEQTVTVWARDKDDVAEFGDLEWGDPKYTFTVKIGTQPHVIFCEKDGTEIPSSKAIEFNETCAEGDNYLYVKLSDRPTNGDPAISAENPLLVNLELKKIGKRGNFELVTNLVAFVNKVSDTKATQVEFDLPSLNGATSTGTRYLVTASVVSDGLNQYGQKWSEYYSGATATVYVYNMPPEIIDVSRLDGTLIASADGTNTCAAGETFTMTWNVQDVLPDLTNGKFKVSWVGVTAKTESPTPATLTIPTDYEKLETDYALEDNGRVFSIANTFVFTAPSTPGVKTVRLTVDDGDGGTATMDWILEVEASKDLIVNAYGPYASAQSKYKAAKGVGQGFVAVDGNPATTVRKFSRTFSFGVSAASATIYAWGYPSKETWDDYVTPGSPLYGVYVDNGVNLLTALDLVDLSGQALSPRGNAWTAGEYYNWSTKGGTDATAGDYDNYFYRWVITQEASDSKSSSSSSDSDNDAAPTWTPMDETKKTFTLDEGTDDGNYATVEAEAIFARELYPLDNLGDINADGIPDQIVALYGIGADEAGKIPNDDLTSLSDFNDDEDYLPNSSTAASYSSLIPGLPSSWTAGQAFTALLEVRGYHEGLNNAPELVGVSKHKLHPDYNSDDVDTRKAARDYSELEMIAWSFVDYDKDWSPERPSDPTKADTDGDGFPDGYEYYFWYRAHVGDPDYFKQTGICRKITGRRYDPRNPGVGTVITSAEIEKIFDPLVAYSGDAATLDTDNDGLPDLLELSLGTNPFDFDTDGDGLPDGWEVMIANLDPLVTNSYADGLSDTARNTDGDAMAISSYKLEHAVLPEQFEPEMMHAKRNTFATMRTGGDVTVVNVSGVKSQLQWYAIPYDSEVELEEGEAVSGYQVTATVDGKTATFFAAIKPDTTDDGLLKSNIDVRTLVDYNDGKALAYPYVLDVGTAVKVEEISDVKSYRVKTAIDAKVANACWIYGKGSARAALGEVADTAAEYGCLALARQCAVEEGAEVVAFPSTDRDVAFLHYLCYQEFGFDPRTAWSSVQPLASRWGKTTDGEAETGTTVAVNGRGGYVSVPTRTRDYANYDEFLVYSFFLNNTPDAMGYDTVDCDPTAPADAKTWYAFTTNPNGPTDDLSKNSTNFWGRTSTNGADTDGDGVPDGWELYTMAGPKDSNGAYVFAPPYAGFLNGKAATMPKSYFSPFVASAKSIDTSTSSYLGGADNNDGLNQFKEFEGTDSIAAYTNVSTTIAHEGSWTWLNKFFPTDPWNADTDGDGVKDGDEKNAFAYGELSDSVETGLFDDGTLRCIPGGGLNPCSVDTDCDGLPDGWEKQFAGTTVSAKHSEGMLDGMDGTVSDAYTVPGGPNRDYDHDGLENWQEYLTGTMRCWRYDDPITPLDYIPFDLYFTTTENADGTVTVTFDAETAAKNMQEAGYLESDDVNEFWFKTLVDSASPAYNPHLVTGQTPGSHYFTRVTNGWDAAYIDADFGKSLGVTGAYYWFYDRVDGQLFKETWAAAWKNIGVSVGSDWAYYPKKYACCSPIDADSDRDGMDDYYEVFHGMNPLLGCSGKIKNIGGFDVVYDSLYGENKTSPEAWNTSGDTDKTVVNFWQRKAADAALAAQQPVIKTPRGTGYDFEAFPWLNGLPTADADGDGIRNQEESIMALVNPSAAWYHTDPTALWMTDASYTNSLVTMNYRLPVREVTVLLPDESFTYGGQTYDFCRYDGFTAGKEANAFAPFKMDAWKVVGDYNENGWVASFEQNEGFDSDHDGVMDQDELKGKYTTKSDPLDADSPRHRQAMYFQGPAKPSILQTMPFVREYHPLTSQEGRYPDDMEFVQFTVECWVNAESLDDSTIIERAILVGESNADDQEFVRRNFRLGIEGGKWVASYDPNDTKTDSICVFSRDAATTGWTHLAATYDMTRLTLYVNGSQSDNVLCGLQPVYSASDIALREGTDDYGSGRPRAMYAMIVGGSVKGYADSKKGLALDVTNGIGFDAYEKFFKGYVDEIRVWDGARSAGEVASAMNQRFTSEDAAANREDVYAEWIKGDASGNYRGRYSKDASGNGYAIPAELRYHWSFDSVFGAADEAAVAKVPAGFNLGASSAEDGARARRTRPDDYVIDWWKTVLDGYAGTVYDDPAWICWIPNTVTHLPRYDGTTLDSVYWSEDFRGATNGTFRFARTAEPASLWTQALRGNVKMTSTEYFATSSRHHLVTTNDTATGSNFTPFYEFTGRHLNQSGDDMLALGGAYAKHIDAMWDSQGPSSNWAISGNDADGDGLPDWWEAYAEDMYRDDAVTGTGDIGWDTIVVWPDQSGTHMTAGEAYLRDLARGYHADKYGDIVTDGSDGDYRQIADLNGNGLPDWWEEIYGIQDEDALADHDNDGLPNYVEYMLSEVFKPLGVVFDPTRADSAQKGIPDYFYKVGELYVGEIFTDHDLVDDAWEDAYGTDYASRRVYDPYEDSDGDGWSNRSENRYSKQSMEIVADEQFHYAATDGLVSDYPIPTIELTVHYSGSQNSTVEKANIIVQTTTSTNLMNGMDATFSIAGVTATQTSGSTGTGTSSSTSSSTKDATGTSYTRSIGKWSNRHAIGTLTPGYINQNSLVLEYCYNPTEETYHWEVVYSATSYMSRSGTRAEYDADRRKYGDGNVALVSRGTEYSTLEDLEIRTDSSGQTAIWTLTSANKTLGTIDLTSGAFDLDLGVFAGVYAVNSTNANDKVSLEDQYYRIAYSANLAVGRPRKLYLGQATDGHVREGKNTIIAFADLDGDGAYTAGEPYGCVTDVDVSWRGTSADITLTETTPLMNRVDPINGLDDRTAIWGNQSGNYTNFTTAALVSGGTKNRIRVVRYQIVGTTGLVAPASEVATSRVILDTVIDTSVSTDTSKGVYANANSWITEANILATGALDLDWDYLNSDVISRINSSGRINSLKTTSYWIIGGVKAVVYGIVIGDGPITESSTNTVNFATVMPKRVFDTTRQSPVPVSVGSGGIVTVGRPTFKWKIPNTEDHYTAFKLKIASKSGSTFSWTSDFQRMPAADENGVYTWSAPVFAGDKPAGATGTFANNQTYTWSISAYNAKFKSDSFVTGGDFLLNVQTNGYDTGTITAKVHYYGPSAVTNSYVTRVYAYESPDFTGTPVAGGVATAFDGENANCRIIGLPKGSYYLQAFVDSNNNGVWDKWETMGYLCTRDGSTADYLNPVAIEFGSKVGATEVAVIYMEDADTDRDNLPDAWEYATATAAQRANGTFLNAKGVSTLTSLNGAEIPVNKSLVTNLLFEIDKTATTTAGLAGDIKSAFSSSASFAALAMGVSDSGSVKYDAATGTLSVNPTVEEGTFAITGVSFDAENGQVSLTLDGDVVAAENVTSTIYAVKTGSTITVKVYRSETLAEEPTLVATRQIVVTGDTLDSSVITVDTDLTASSGFFKVVVE